MFSVRWSHLFKMFSSILYYRISFSLSLSSDASSMLILYHSHSKITQNHCHLFLQLINSKIAQQTTNQNSPQKVNSFFFSQRICRTTSPSFSPLLPFNLCGSLPLLPRLVPLAVVVALLQYSLASSSWFHLSISHTPRCCRRVPDSNISCNYHNQILPSRNLSVRDWDTRFGVGKSRCAIDRMSESI